VTGEDATVLAFVLASNAGRVAYEVLNQQTPATFVYRVDGPEGLATLNRALDDAGFQAAAAHAAGLTAQARPAAGAQVLAASLAGQVPHDAQWPDRIAGLLELR
jgi:hypothetical protein